MALQVQGLDNEQLNITNNSVYLYPNRVREPNIWKHTKFRDSMLMMEKGVQEEKAPHEVFGIIWQYDFHVNLDVKTFSFSYEKLRRIGSSRLPIVHTRFVCVG